MEIIKYPQRSGWETLIQRPNLDVSSLFGIVQAILDEVRQEGDEAVKRYGEKFDKVKLTELLVTEEEISQAETFIPDELKQAINIARDNIAKFHASQQFRGERIETTPGVVCWQKAVAIEKVGLYIPGGSAPLFSTVLMLAVPALIAGCKEIILCAPPGRDGTIHPAILYAAQVAGVSRIYKIGGIQAVGAMAYGTQSVPKVYKILGRVINM